MSANDLQVGGSHYKNKPIQPWDYIVANNMGFLDGNIVKYVTRYAEKGGVEDIEKVIHYAQKIKEVELAKNNEKRYRLHRVVTLLLSVLKQQKPLA